MYTVAKSKNKKSRGAKANELDVDGVVDCHLRTSHTAPKHKGDMKGRYGRYGLKRKGDMKGRYGRYGSKPKGDMNGRYGRYG